MQITWYIANLDRRTSDGFVITAHWVCCAEDGEFSASVYSTCSWAEGQPTVPYDALTQETVLGWVWASVDKQATEDAVTAQINSQKHPIQASGLPW